VRRLGSLLAYTAASAVSPAAPAFAQQIHFDIPAQSATSGLLVLSQQADVQILSARRDTREKRTSAVRGVMTAAQALQRMLLGTGLWARQTSERTFTILAVTDSKPVLDTPGGRSEFADPRPTESPRLESEIVVTGLRRSLRDALQTKRSAALISDNITSNEIGQLPNVTIAEELNRLPGVNTMRDRGNASQASVRGMGPRFVFGLLNGREIATSEPSQEVRWEVYPFEVVSGVQVYKAQDSSLVPGGIAAAIDIRTVRPLDYNGPTVTVHGGPTYYGGGSTFRDYSPWGHRGSAGAIKHLAANLAVAVGISAQRTKNGYPYFTTWGWNTPAATGGTPANPVGHTGDLNGDGSPDYTLWGLSTVTSRVAQDRKALMTNLGWKPSERLTINLDALYSRYRIKDDQAQSWFGNNILGNWDNASSPIYNAPGTSYEIVDGSVVAAHLPGSGPNYQSEIANYRETHDLLASGANIAWTKGPWDLTLDLSHSLARRDNQWQAIYLADQTATDLDFDLRGKPWATISGPQVWNPSLQVASLTRPGRSDGPERTRDRISAIAADLKRRFDRGFVTSLQIGTRLSDRVKQHRRFAYDVCPGSTTSGICDANAHDIWLGDFVATEDFPGYRAPPMVSGDWDFLWSRVYPAADVPPNSEALLQHTRVGFRSLEAFSKAGFETNLGAVPLTGSLGMRIAHVRTKSAGFQQDENGDFSPVTVSNKYSNVLPALNVTAKLSENQQLRLGAGSAISRPPLDALVTGFTLNRIEPGQNPTGGGGNPTLKPFKARQLDLSYENYFHEESLFALAIFYKNLRRFIGSGEVHRTFNGTDYLITTLTEAKGGNVYGLESTFQSRFYFLPGMLKDFGIYASYSYARTDVHEFAPAGNPYLMVGSAKHSAQLDGFYGRGPLELRLSMKYHSRYMISPTWVATQLRESDPETLVDASLSYQLTRRFALRLQAANLTDAVNRQTQDNNPQNLTIYQRFGRSCFMDLSFRF
jgi:TonB-dependent receptor